jgi:HEAT repeat protein
MEDRMSKAGNSHSGAAMREVLNLFVWCALLTLTGVAYGQEEQGQSNTLAYAANKANVPDAIAKVKSGDFNGVHVEIIAEAGAAEAIPILKEQFARSQDPFLKAKIASAVVRLGDKDNTYWDFLVKLATPAVESDAPDFMNYDSDGRAKPGPSPEFVAWAKAHNVSPQSVGEDSLYWLPAKVLLLGSTSDPRAIPLLRRALLSPNHQIEVAAALGLAETRDEDSIPLIIEACRRAPAEAAAVIAKSLVYFDDPQAQGAADEYIPKDMAKQDREARARGEKPLGEKPLN